MKHGTTPRESGYLIAQGGIAVFHGMNIAEMDVGKIVERLKEVARFAAENGEVDCHLIDGGILTVHTDGTVSALHPPLRFQPNGEPERRRILAREVLEAI
jgi:hypothetical protein